MHVSNPQDSDFNDLPIEHEQRFFTKQPMYCLTNIIIERLKVSMIKLLLDKGIYIYIYIYLPGLRAPQAYS